MSESSWSGFLPKNAVIMAKRTSKSPAKFAQSTQSIAPVPGDSMEKIAKELEGCTRCKLSQGRTNIVLGEGSLTADLVFVGEAPGEEEDIQSRPFVGRSGQLLEKMIQAIGLTREQVFIANVAKCRPPENRNPELDEIESCSPYLHRQLDVIKPKVIVALGKFASQTLLATETRISDLRGQWFDYRGVKLIPTYHPAYLLRNPSSKKETWEDFQAVARELGIKIPKGV
jgi:DNA polymerase